MVGRILSMYFFWLVLVSLVNCCFIVLLMIFVIVFFVCLLLVVEWVCIEVKVSFVSIIFGIDLIVGVCFGLVNLLFYLVFCIGNVINNICWDSYWYFVENLWVKWVILIFFGDLYCGYWVMGIDVGYFEYYCYGCG